jgi:hypothetical protein
MGMVVVEVRSFLASGRNGRHAQERDDGENGGGATSAGVRNGAVDEASLAGRNIRLDARRGQ